VFDFPNFFFAFCKHNTNEKSEVSRRAKRISNVLSANSSNHKMIWILFWLGILWLWYGTKIPQESKFKSKHNK